jgi:hypothetical protein
MDIKIYPTHIFTSVTTNAEEICGEISRQTSEGHSLLRYNTL